MCVFFHKKSTALLLLKSKINLFIKTKVMKATISESVYKKIYTLIQKIKSPEGKQLGNIITNAKVVKDNELKNDVVSINSMVEFKEDSLNKPIRLQIVLPEEVDISKRKISVFAPISIALFGFKENDKFQWELQSGNKNIEILKVVNS